MRNGPQIVTNGLVLALDAADRLSYAGSGTAWNDLTRSTAGVTLVNGPTFSQSNSGIISFDGVNDYSDFNLTGLGSTVTIEMWMKINTLTSLRFPAGWLYYGIWAYNNAFGYTTYVYTDLYGLTSTQVTNLGLVGNWRHYVFEMRSDVAYTNNKIYVNGVSQSLSQVFNFEYSPYRNFNSGSGRISGWRVDTSAPFPMDVGVFKIYNRSLTVAEVQQNFNALRGRFRV